MTRNANDFLDALRPNEFEFIRAGLKTIPMVQGHTLAVPGDAIEQVYFPHSGFISVVVPLESGDRIEAAVVGRSGLFGGSVGLGVAIHLNAAIVQMPGSASTISADLFAQLSRMSENVRAITFQHNQFMLAQIQQTAACNARHHLPSRLSTWLLRAQDAAGQSELTLTQEFLAQMMGVQRASVSVVAADLQDKNLIRYRRGHIQITDLEGLKTNACECHRAIRLQYERLLGAGSSDTGRRENAGSVGLSHQK